MGTMEFPKKVVQQVAHPTESDNPLSAILIIIGLLAAVGILIWQWIANSFYAGFRWGFFAFSIGLIAGTLVDAIDDEDEWSSFFVCLLMLAVPNAVGFIWGSKTFTWVAIIIIILAFSA